MKILPVGLLSALSLLLLLSSTAGAIEPIVKLDGIHPKPGIFAAASRTEPLVIDTKEKAAEQFDEVALEKLTETVNLDEQFVLVFAWRGSGQDKLDYVVAESFPEQITFTYTPGRTRDLRPHLYVFALRNNVTWRVAQ